MRYIVMLSQKVAVNALVVVVSRVVHRGSTYAEP